MRIATLRAWAVARWQRIPRAFRWAAIALTLTYSWARWWPMAPLFNDPLCTVVTDRTGLPLGAMVAADGQWRMSSTGPVPERFARCLITFEDQHFRGHPGIHLPSLYRAWRQNREAARVVSGGSTLTMQLARMALGSRSRSYSNKLREMALALRIECQWSKDRIIRSYADHAPFGGNVVGLEAAAWRWFGRPADQLGWAECATLAVLPNAPGIMHPGKGREALRKKRDRLLERLHLAGDIDGTTYSLAIEEPLPEAPVPMPGKAPHLIGLAHLNGFGGRMLRTTLDAALQERVTRALIDHATLERANEVHNAAVLVMDISTAEVLAYVGNVPNAGDDHAEDVDLVQAPRSTGSLLKTFLYAAMLEHGELMPDQLVADLPTQYDGFSPRNFSEGFDGAVPASSALARSLNVPAVRALRAHGIHRTLNTLRAMGLDHLDRGPDHYGLALIIGGAESTLWELTGAYASMARILLERTGTPIIPPAVHPPRIWMDVPPRSQTGAVTRPPFGAGAVHHTLNALFLTHRPESETGWEYYDAPKGVAWKTGTSFGHRDAWAIGMDGRHAVGVWVGNANGEGRPGLTGTRAAAPILFDVFDLLPSGRPFHKPHEDLMAIPVCASSGHRAGTDCQEVDTLEVLAQAMRTPTCPYHHRIRVNEQATARVAEQEPGRMVSWFILPPAMEHFFRLRNPGHKPVPPYAGSIQEEPSNPIALIYPEHGTQLFLPRLADGRIAQLVLQATHRYPDRTLYWDLDGTPMGSTRNDHRLALDLSSGIHTVTLTDGEGRTIGARFTVLQGGPDAPVGGIADDQQNLTP
jgi:penicillin-binding protein 1C